jgi:hypothetical protein
MQAPVGLLESFRNMSAHLGRQLPLGGCSLQGRSSERWLLSGSLSKPTTGLNKQVQARLISHKIDGGRH